MTKSLEALVADINDVSDHHDEDFTAQSPLSKVVSIYGLAPEALLVLMSHHTGVAQEDLDDIIQNLLETTPKITLTQVFDLSLQIKKPINA